MSINFNQLVDTKDAPGLNIFVLCLGDEHSYLNEKSHWINNTSHRVRVARLSKEDFNTLDMGKHPKVWVLKDGEEKLQINGIPTYEEFSRHIKGIS